MHPHRDSHLATYTGVSDAGTNHVQHAITPRGIAIYRGPASQTQSGVDIIVSYYCTGFSRSLIPLLVYRSRSGAVQNLRIGLGTTVDPISPRSVARRA
jgi:hypothetical protein